jgi:hypothetical protein
MRSRDAYPIHADSETRLFVRYWFDQRNRRELASLSGCISRVRDDNLRTPLWCAFSRLIIAKQAGASLALDLAHSRPHRVHGKPTIIRPFQAFLSEVEKVIKAAPFHGTTHPAATVACGDARALTIENESVDVVITSPPYANGIDYQRTTKFSLVWMGHRVGALRTVRATNIGTEAGGRNLRPTPTHELAFRAMGRVVALPDRSRNILRRYIVDMDVALREIARALVPGGRALLVIGDSSTRGAYVKNSCALRVLARAAGLRLIRERRRRLPPNRRYLPPPHSGREALGARLRTETVLYFQKPERVLKLSPRVGADTGLDRSRP